MEEEEALGLCLLGEDPKRPLVLEERPQMDVKQLQMIFTRTDGLAMARQSLKKGKAQKKFRPFVSIRLLLSSSRPSESRSSTAEALNVISQMLDELTIRWRQAGVSVNIVDCIDLLVDQQKSSKDISSSSPSSYRSAFLFQQLDSLKMSRSQGQPSVIVVKNLQESNALLAGLQERSQGDGSSSSSSGKTKGGSWIDSQLLEILDDLEDTTPHQRPGESVDQVQHWAPRMIITTHPPHDSLISRRLLDKITFSFTLQSLLSALIDRMPSVELMGQEKEDHGAFLLPFFREGGAGDQTLSENVREFQLKHWGEGGKTPETQDLLSKIRGKGAHKSIRVEKRKVDEEEEKLDQTIVGCESLKKEWKRIILWPSRRTEAMNRLQIPLSGGLLVYGPPGCGKTYSVLKAASVCHGGRRVFHVEGPKIFSKWLGDAEKNVRQLFSEARSQPSIIIIDEVDSLGSSRSQLSEASSTASSVQQRVLCTLLAEMDGVGDRVTDEKKDKETSKERKVIVIGCTSRPDRLDEALVRPGRFDQIAYLGPPSLEERLLLLQKLSRLDSTSSSSSQIKDSSPVVDASVSQHLVDVVSVSTEGFSFADMQQLWREVCLSAVEEWSSTDPPVSQNAVIFPRHFDEALLSIEPRPVSDEMLSIYREFSSKKNLS